ncbi:MAG: hypothetical protein AAF218_09275, partial [Pseudomonadota bacterium]
RVVIVLCLLAALSGLWLGLRSQPLDESAAIVAAVERYVAETGGAATDCVAVPGKDVWLEVLCDRARYVVRRDGTILRQGPSI